MSQFSNFGSGAPVLTAYDKAVNNCRGLVEAGQYDAAIRMLREVLKQSPRDVQVLRMLGHSLMMIDSPVEAIRHLTFASKLDPKNPDLLCDLASALRRMDEMRKAHQAADSALKLAPNYARAIMTKARLLQSHGQFQRAYELIDQALEKKFDPMLIATYGQLCRELKYQDKGIDMMRKALETPTLTRAARTDILMVLGHLLDSVGEYDEAFECFRKGNTMSGEPSHVNVEKYLERWDPELFRDMPSSGVDGSRAVFIVGMPRSGTTLTEQIIASHPCAGGIGESLLIGTFTRDKELDAFDQSYIDQSAKEYLEMLSEHFPDRSIKRVCDKMPENYYYLGFITKALPGAHIIHCKRDPIDTCLSIYFQRFGPRLTYATDLEHCAKQYLVYTKVMEHMTERFGIEVHDAVYEQTTTDPEGSIRAMLDYVGLPFDRACMEFHKSKKAVHTASVAQIRKPMYTSSMQRWKHYEKHIGSMIEILAPVLAD